MTDNLEAEKPSAATESGGSPFAICSARAGLDDAQLGWLLREMEKHGKLRGADNRKILWLAMNTPAWQSADVMGVESDILAEVENRLYPEYDGERVTYQAWGWRTPDGDLRYLPNAERSHGG